MNQKTSTRESATNQRFDSVQISESTSTTPLPQPQLDSAPKTVAISQALHEIRLDAANESRESVESVIAYKGGE